MPTIGNHLRKTREGRDLSVDDVAHSTRIPAKIVRRLEADDYSRFPSSAYARSYLRKYGDHLGVEVKRELRSLEAGATGPSPREIPLDPKKSFGGWRSALPWNRPWKVRKEKKPNRTPIFLSLILVLLFAAVGIFYIVGYRADSYEEARDRIVDALPVDKRPETEAKKEDAVLAANESDQPEEIRAIPIWEERKESPSREADAPDEGRTSEAGANGGTESGEKKTASGEAEEESRTASAEPPGAEENDYPDGAYRQDPPAPRAPEISLDSAAAN